MNKVVLITGASSGMGKSAAGFLLKSGCIVYGAARRVHEMEDLRLLGMKVLPLDMTVDSSIQSCVETILEQEGRIDVLINNAGYGSYGSVEEVSIEEAKRQFEVNIFGLARLTQLFLPTMRNQKSGRIINISSMGGKMYTPFGAWYHATKHALEGWSDCLRLELKQKGIDMVIVQPGGIKTEWGEIAAENLLKVSGEGPYQKEAKSVALNMERLYRSKQLTNQDVLGATIAKAALTAHPKRRYTQGYMAKPALLARKWLGDAIFDRIIMFQMK